MQFKSSWLLICACTASFVGSPSQDLVATSQTSPQVAKPTIGVTILPSEPIPATGTCRSSTGGYLTDERGRTDLSPHDFARLVQDDLRQGYIVTVYPKTKSGFFVALLCVAKPTTAGGGSQ
jgi:hypothetical protein